MLRRDFIKYFSATAATAAAGKVLATAEGATTKIALLEAKEIVLPGTEADLVFDAVIRYRFGGDLGYDKGVQGFRHKVSFEAYCPEDFPTLQVNLGVTTFSLSGRVLSVEPAFERLKYKITRFYITKTLEEPRVIEVSGFVV